MAQTRLTPPPARWGFRFTTRDIAVTGALGAIAVVLGLVPGLGFIPAPTPAGNATTMHIPAIVAGILEGPVVGAMVGAIFGIFSFTQDATGIFKNPVIAFLPRVLIGVISYLVYRVVLGRFARGVATVAVGAGLFTILGPGARDFEAAYAAGKIKASWLIDLYHQVAVLTAPAIWIGLAVGLLGAVIAYLLLRGENAAPAAAAVAGTLTNTVGVLGLIVAFGILPSGAAFVIGATHGLPEVILAVLITVPVARAVRAMRGGTAL